MPPDPARVSALLPLRFVGCRPAGHRDYRVRHIARSCSDSIMTGVCLSHLFRPPHGLQESLPSYGGFMRTVVTRAVLCTVLSFASLQPSLAGDFRVTKIHFDSAQPLGDMASGCGNSAECTALVTSAAASLGVNPSLVEVTSNAVGQTQAPSSEERVFSVSANPGYVYCRGLVNVSSYAAGTINATNAVTGIGAYTHVPRVQPAAGTNWIVGDIEVISVRNDRADYYYAAGNCKRPAGGKLFECRGKPCAGWKD